MIILYSKQAKKFLEKQDKKTQLRIISAIEQIPQGDIKKMVNSSFYRLRVGDYRIIFDKNGTVISIYKIDNRGEVYKRGN